MRQGVGSKLVFNSYHFVDFNCVVKVANNPLVTESFYAGRVKRAETYFVAIKRIVSIFTAKVKAHIATG